MKIENTSPFVIGYNPFSNKILNNASIQISSELWGTEDDDEIVTEDSDNIVWRKS